jgi:hypothetical protein
MAHFAKLDENNVVVTVSVGRDDDTEMAIFARSGDVYKQTSYNTSGGVHRLGGTPYRKNYAGIGYTYDAERDAFIPPQPFASWMLNEDTCLWNAPTPYPNDGNYYLWNEESQSWNLITE